MTELCRYVENYLEDMCSRIASVELVFQNPVFGTSSTPYCPLHADVRRRVSANGMPTFVINEIILEKNEKEQTS